MRVGINKRLKKRLQGWLRKGLALIDRVIIIRLPLRPANAHHAATLIDMIYPDASPADIMTTWCDRILRKGKNERDELGRALRMSSGRCWNSEQGDWWHKRYGQTPQNTGMAETIAAHLRHFQTDDQIAHAEKQSKDKVRGSVSRALYFEIQKVPAGIQREVVVGVLEELGRRAKTGE